MAKRNAANKATTEPAILAFDEGVAAVRRHPLTAPLLERATIIRTKNTPWVYGETAWCIVSSDGHIRCNPKRRGAPQEWSHAVAHALLHLGLGHFQEKANPRLWNAACDVVVFRMLQEFGFRATETPEHGDASIPAASESDIYAWMVEQGCPSGVWVLGTAGMHSDMAGKPIEVQPWNKKWADCFVEGLRAAVRQAVDVAGGRILRLDDEAVRVSAAEEARRWFIGHFPLLGAVATAFRIIEDPAVCRNLSVAVAAINAMVGEIYVNPAASLKAEELRFVMAHEFLHAALRHQERRRGRDPYLWNIACDYIINGWLLEMGVGVMPVAALHDPQLKGLSAESVYDRLCTDLRQARKLATLRGVGLCDILDGGGPSPGSAEWTDLDAFYRRALMDGLDLHRASGRGLIPAGLVEEIRSLAHPPIAWDVELARWFDEQFTPVETIRTFARLSRRQAATPDIPRPSRRPAIGEEEGRTFGVVLDSSGSMDRVLLGKALGAIASYAVAKDVRHVRVVFCDAAAYDQGYMDVLEIASNLTVRGRGGTALQPGIDLLQKAEDFPSAAPLLVITDGWCDVLSIQREHALLIPAGARLPFVPRGPIFRLQ